MVAVRTMPSVESRCRMRALASAPATAPTPNAPSIAPKVSGPPAIRTFTTIGSSAISELAPMPNRKLRSSTLRMSGDIAT